MTDQENNVLSLCGISEDLVPQPKHQESKVEPLSFSNLLRPGLLLQTDQQQCGGQLWPAGMVLGAYILSHKLQEMSGKIIFELGAGSGLVGLAVALGLSQSPKSESVDSTHITITDGLPILIPLMKQNITLNAGGISHDRIKVDACMLRWGEPIPPSYQSQKPDVVLAADCAYLEEAFPLLVTTLQHLMGENTVLYFCFKKRRKRDRDCIRLIGKHFGVKAIHGEWEKDSVWLYEVRCHIKATQ